METAGVYRRFAEGEVRGRSAVYEELASRISEDPGVLALIDGLPAAKRQPNLLLAAVRFLGGPVEDYPAFREWVTAHWPRLHTAMLERRTQTNEPGRCATLLPVLAGLPQPLALIEVGASAGLCLYPDRYRYRYDGLPPLGPAGGPVLACRTAGPVPIPERLPSVVWRAGADLHPLDVRSAQDVRWLECLVWPGQPDRLDRLREAVRVARADPPLLVRGDLNRVVRDLVSRVPSGATPVVMHSAVLAYLSPENRDTFVTAMRDLPGHWISNEAPHVLPSVAARLPRPAPRHRATFTLSLDGHPLAFTDPHGDSLEWLTP